METGSCVNLEYDSQGRIIKLTAQTGNKQEVINYIYNDNGTYSQDYNVTTLEETGSVMTAYVESGIELMSSDGSYDDVITDSSVKKRINEAQDVWNKVPSMRTLAHIEAEVARADYCVVYPKSEFAKRFFAEYGTSNIDGLHFKRTLSYTTPQMYGSDIIALQRALMAYGYLESTDVKAEDYGYFGPTTEAAVIEYQTDKGLGIDGKAGPATLKSMFSAGSSNNKGNVTFEGLNRKSL